MKERYAQGAAFFRRCKMGLFTFTMMMKTVRITKSLVMEIRIFCMLELKQAPYQCIVKRLLNVEMRRQDFDVECFR